MRVPIVVAGLVLICTQFAIASDELDSTDEYLDLLEIEVAEVVCADKALLKSIRSSELTCLQRSIDKLPACTKQLHTKAPKASEQESLTRLSKSEFSELYAQCLKDQLLRR